LFTELKYPKFFIKSPGSFGKVLQGALEKPSKFWLKISIEILEAI